MEGGAEALEDALALLDAATRAVRLSGSTRANEETTGARGRWSLVQLSLEPRARSAARELLEATKSQAT